VAALGGCLKTDASRKGKQLMPKQEMMDLFNKHVDAELAGDLDTTMATMSPGG
jgi:hypothetical protein